MLKDIWVNNQYWEIKYWPNLSLCMWIISKIIHSDAVKPLIIDLFCFLSFTILLYFHLFAALWFRCGSAKTVPHLSSRSPLFKHYRLDHGYYGWSLSYPCTFTDCSCRFKSWNALKSHLSRSHSNHKTVRCIFKGCTY